MTIALFSDIHANLPALDAMFDDMQKHQIDSMYCLGDLVGYNCWPNEVIELIRSKNIATIAGNYDYGIGRTSDDCGCAYKTEEEKANGKISIAYTNKAVSRSSRQYLRCLPMQIQIELHLATKINLLLVHGSPRKINEYLFEDRDEKSMLRIMQHAQADIMCFGHTHKPYHKVLIDESGKKFYHAINTGSVGKPKDGNPKGCYVLISFNENSGTQDASSVDVKFERFNYDTERAAAAIENSELPNTYAISLRTGF
ncbi:MAG: metallophosphoesterase family protein [Bacteroidetes bacterium]|nr:metallophosphoesterase family protein [Bacteroidota bacterium]